MNTKIIGAGLMLTSMAILTGIIVWDEFIIATLEKENENNRMLIALQNMHIDLLKEKAKKYRKTE